MSTLRRPVSPSGQDVLVFHDCDKILKIFKKVIQAHKVVGRDSSFIGLMSSQLQVITDPLSLSSKANDCKGQSRERVCQENRMSPFETGIGSALLEKWKGKGAMRKQEEELQGGPGARERRRVIPRRAEGLAVQGLCLGGGALALGTPRGCCWQEAATLQGTAPSPTFFLSCLS